jgi:lipoprotein Spr
MKHLFFVAVAAGIFSGTTISVKAQTNVNIERYSNKVQPKNSPKFIESIVMQPEATKNTIVLAEVGIASDEVKIIKHSGSVSTFAGNIEQCSKLQFKYAMMMDTEVEGIANFPLYSFIDDWWGTRYHYGGSDRSGIDCSAFTAKLLSDVYGITVPRTAKDQFKICEQVNTDDLVEGDLVFFNTRGGVSHVGLYLGHNNFVHSSVNGGVTISSLTDAYYSKKFISGGRIVLASTQLAVGH